MGLDVAMVRNASGKLTLAKNAAGGFFLDDRAVYAVFATTFARKGDYAYDATLGTFLHKVRRDGRLTGSRINAAATDAIDQCRQDRAISAGSSSARRLTSGAWELALEWTVPGRGAVRDVARL